MGGLRGRMPFTHAVFLIGSLALVGIPPLSGFWSKDAIIASALATGGVLGWILFLAGLAGALLTGLYSFGSTCSSSTASRRRSCRSTSTDGHEHGEGAALDAAACRRARGVDAIGGFLSVPGLWNLFATGCRTWRAAREPTTAQDYLTSLIAVALGVFGSARAACLQRGPRAGGEPRRADGARAQALLRRALRRYLLAGRHRRSLRLRDDVETPVVQGSLVEIGSGVRDAAGGVARLQTGLVRT